VGSLIRSPDPGGPEACEVKTEPGTEITLFRAPDGTCIPELLIAYQCSGAAPVIEATIGGRHRRFLGGRFAVQVHALPSGARLAGSAAGMSVFTVDLETPWLFVRSGSTLSRWLPLPKDVGRQEPPRAFLVGDSILLGAEAAVEAALPDWLLQFDDAVGRGSISGVALATEQAGLHADAVVVELGTNDEDPVAFRENLRQTLDVLRDVPLVVWQTAHGPLDTIPGVNAAIRDELGRYPNTAIADWDAVAADDELSSDGIHPLPGSTGAIAELLAPFLRQWHEAASGPGTSTCGRDIAP
jgi:lysophospholipase L1-like esterase